MADRNVVRVSVSKLNALADAIQAKVPDVADHDLTLPEMVVEATEAGKKIR